MAERLILAGPMADRAALETVLGADVSFKDAVLDDCRLCWQPGARLCSLKHEPGCKVAGLLIETDAAQARRLAYFLEGGQRRKLRARSPAGDDLGQAALFVKPDAGGQEPFDAGSWARVWRETFVYAAEEYMQGMGRMKAEDAAARWPAMMMRAGARARASHSDSPATLRVPWGHDKARITRFSRPYSLYFTVEEHDLRFARFDGKMSDEVTRASFVDGDAITVLPYDPVRDRVLLVEQFRFGPYVRGEPIPWMLEAVAGRIDPGETPQMAAQRELKEETGLDASSIMEIARYYPSAGAVTGYFFSYLAICDLPDTAAQVLGLESEAEDIRGHVVGFAQAMDLVASHEAQAGPLTLSLFWLEHRRGQFAGAAGA